MRKNASWHCRIRSIPSRPYTDFSPRYKYAYLDEPTYHDGEPPEGIEKNTQGDTLFRIVNLARETFKVNVALISLLDDECQYFKSEVGMTALGLRNMEQMPRDISFCGHTILNKAPLVILDCSKDWRMASNPLVVNPPGVRFYAGVPIIAPEGYALGTLCLIDTEPRTEFHGGAKMQELSQLAMLEIRALYEQNQQAKMAKMHDALSGFPAPLVQPNSSTHVTNALEMEESRLQMRQDFTPEQQQAVLKAGRNQGLKVVAKTGELATPRADRSTATTAPAEVLPTNMPSSALIQPSATVLAPEGEHMLGRPVGEEQQVERNTLPTSPSQTQGNALQSSAPPSSLSAAQNPYDLSVLLIAQTLNLDLVYLLALDQDKSGGIATRVVSSHGLATDPVFDAGLHGRALRSKSGLLYVHPDPDSEVAKELGTYISGMLVPVLQLSGGGGYVLAAFTKKKSQIFVAEDLKFLRDFGITLMKWLLAADAKELESNRATPQATVRA